MPKKNKTITKTDLNPMFMPSKYKGRLLPMDSVKTFWTIVDQGGNRIYFRIDSKEKDIIRRMIESCKYRQSVTVSIKKNRLMGLTYDESRRLAMDYEEKT